MPFWMNRRLYTVFIIVAFIMMLLFPLSMFASTLPIISIFAILTRISSTVAGEGFLAVLRSVCLTE
jgi:hypothetical protein